MVDASRRGFLRGRPRPKAEIRPPWALPETDFVDRCTRCGDCLSACPQKILVAGDGGFPDRRFQPATNVLSAAIARPHASRWRWSAPKDCRRGRTRQLVGDACLPKRGVECRVCGDFCDVRAIRFAPRLGNSPLPAIDNALCTGCGACVGPCPTAAIRILG